MTTAELKKLGIGSQSTLQKFVRYGWFTSDGRSIPPAAWCGQRFVAPVANLPSDLDKGDGMKLNEARRRPRNREL